MGVVGDLYSTKTLLQNNTDTFNSKFFVMKKQISNLYFIHNNRYIGMIFIFFKDSKALQQLRDKILKETTAKNSVMPAQST